MSLQPEAMKTPAAKILVNFNILFIVISVIVAAVPAASSTR